MFRQLNYNFTIRFSLKLRSQIWSIILIFSRFLLHQICLMIYSKEIYLYNNTWIGKISQTIQLLIQTHLFPVLLASIYKNLISALLKAMNLHGYSRHWIIDCYHFFGFNSNENHDEIIAEKIFIAIVVHGRCFIHLYMLL